MNIALARIKQMIGLRLDCFLMLLILSSTTSLSAEQYSVDVYNQKLEQYIASVNASKAVLDASEQTASVLEQKKALCLRIDAYKNIVKISQDNPQYQNALMMQLISQAFLDRQQASFADSGVNETDFCMGLEVETVSN